MRNVIKTTLAIFTVSAFATNASAALIAFTDRADWEAAVSGNFLSEDFSSTSSGDYMTSAIDVGDFTVSMTGSSFGTSWHNISSIGAGGSALNSVDGSQQLNVATGSTGGTTLEFDFDIYAFGADFAYVSDSRTTSFLIDGVQLDIPYLDSEFFGFVSDTAFSANFLTLTSGGADGFGMDNLVYAASVPEPGTLALLGLGLAGIGFSRKKVNA